MLSDKGFLNEHTLNYEYQQMDNIAIFLYILLINKKIRIKNEHQFQFPFTSEVISIVTQNILTISKKRKNVPFLTKKMSLNANQTTKLCNWHDLAHFTPPAKNQKQKMEEYKQHINTTIF